MPSERPGVTSEGKKSAEISAGTAYLCVGWISKENPE